MRTPQKIRKSIFKFFDRRSGDDVEEIIERSKRLNTSLIIDIYGNSTYLSPIMWLAGQFIVRECLSRRL